MGSTISKILRGDFWCIIPKRIRSWILSRERKAQAEKEAPFFDKLWPQAQFHRDLQNDPNLPHSMECDVSAEVLMYVSLHRRRMIAEDLDFSGWLFPTRHVPEEVKPLYLRGSASRPSI
ncbi:hypothetical protein FKW77_006568 [Venturia effusa]|uniref:Uncharacterized protein n=1 Tax=Venturia effusa TaxID=50376 RepID=A0A517LN39_9PEZI|nr:hypothetical protein FKW77_006568 [Venturia effusa]